MSGIICHLAAILPNRRSLITDNICSCLAANQSKCQQCYSNVFVFFCTKMAPEPKLKLSQRITGKHSKQLNEIKIKKNIKSTNSSEQKTHLLTPEQQTHKGLSQATLPIERIHNYCTTLIFISTPSRFQVEPSSYGCQGSPLAASNTRAHCKHQWSRRRVATLTLLPLASPHSSWS